MQCGNVVPSPTMNDDPHAAVRLGVVGRPREAELERVAGGGGEGAVDRLLQVGEQVGPGHLEFLTLKVAPASLPLAIRYARLLAPLG